MTNTETGIAQARNRQLQNTASGPFAKQTRIRAHKLQDLLGGGMRKLILMSAIVVLVAGSFAQAQKIGKQKPDPIGPPVREQMINLEDDATGSFLTFDASTGKYMFTRCSDGTKLGGVGSVKVDGCSISLEDSQAEHRLVASVNQCSQEGKALVEQFAPAEAFKLILKDVNMDNNLLDCAPKK